MASSMTQVDTTWTTPRTWVTGELVTKTLLDSHLRDQLNALKTPASFYGIIDQGTDYTITGTSFASIDTTYLQATSLTTGGGIILCGFVGSFQHSSAGGRAYLDILVDGSTRVGLDDGLVTCREYAAAGFFSLSFTVPIPGLSAGAHTLTLQWKTSGATLTMFAGAGTATGDVHTRYWGVELA